MFFPEFFPAVVKSYNVFSVMQVKGADHLHHLMRKNAFDEGSEGDRYTGEPSGKTPELKTPPSGLSALEKALESNLTPPPLVCKRLLVCFRNPCFFVVLELAS